MMIAERGNLRGSHSPLPEELELSRDDDHYSLTTGILPSSGASSNSRIKLKPFIMAPYDRRYKDTTVTPSITDNIVNGSFVVDIVLIFFVTKLPIFSWITGNRLLGSMQEFGWPLMSSLAFLLSLFKRYHLFLSKLMGYSTCFVFGVFEESVLRFLGLRRTKTITTLDSSLWPRYVISIYWSITTLTTVGYGDLHSGNSKEMIFNVLYTIFNLGLTVYLIGNMTDLVVHDTNRKFSDTMQDAMFILDSHQFGIHDLEADLDVAYIGLHLI
ncbi:hypothetical protein VNO77_27259 [Canavalia gladiata]|uniref:Potassium channel domain-containing protein n=1 Tax=Canavalia gladiata TaxID=3824 RepID=A0AAN9KYI7_CANGL